ncbi:ATP-binding protein [Streptomyces sp. SUK 48]|uniref:ATP-binding protein n=1 Tax=Streptomyces sp. SUK 48 TaxID=2582831 RepID=UPI001FB92FA1|nr:ATP-binding protein [Streptomyces sp. SUK 48]
MHTEHRPRVLLRLQEPISDAATHVIAELAANAATHGRVPGRNFQLTLNVVGDTLRVEVTDTRRERLPKAQHPGAEEESGRGLLIVAALADRWGVSSDAVPRKTVWAELTVPVGD